MYFKSMCLEAVMHHWNKILLVIARIYLLNTPRWILTHPRKHSMLQNVWHFELLVCVCVTVLDCNNSEQALSFILSECCTTLCELLEWVVNSCVQVRASLKKSMICISNKSSDVIWKGVLQDDESFPSTKWDIIKTQCLMGSTVIIVVAPPSNFQVAH